MDLYEIIPLYHRGNPYYRMDSRFNVSRCRQPDTFTAGNSSYFYPDQCDPGKKNLESRLHLQSAGQCFNVIWGMDSENYFFQATKPAAFASYM
jgi:hypothetical protein